MRLCYMSHDLGGAPLICVVSPSRAMEAISAIPVFHVKDVDASVKFYTQVLGFTEAFRYGTYVGLQTALDAAMALRPPGASHSGYLQAVSPSQTRPGWGDRRTGRQ
jgi:hypothetical protein